MRYTDSKAQHLGGGIVLFENAIELEWDWVRKVVDEFIQDEWNEMYKPGIDPETNEEIYGK